MDWCFIFLCLCVWRSQNYMRCWAQWVGLGLGDSPSAMWITGDWTQVVSLVFHQVNPGNETQVVQLDSKFLYPLGHLTNPQIDFFKYIFSFLYILACKLSFDCPPPCSLSPSPPPIIPLSNPCFLRCYCFYFWSQPLPEKFIVKGMVERFNDDFIETRRKALHKFLNRIADHPTLTFNEDFKVFLTAQASVSGSILYS